MLHHRILERKHLLSLHSFTNRKLGCLDTYACNRRNSPSQRQRLSLGIHHKVGKNSLWKPLSVVVFCSQAPYVMHLFFFSTRSFFHFVTLVVKFNGECGSFTSRKSALSLSSETAGCFSLLLLHRATVSPQTRGL